MSATPPPPFILSATPPPPFILSATPPPPFILSATQWSRRTWHMRKRYQWQTLFIAGPATALAVPPTVIPAQAGTQKRYQWQTLFIAGPATALAVLADISATKHIFSATKHLPLPPEGQNKTPSKGGQSVPSPWGGNPYNNAPCPGLTARNPCAFKTTTRNSAGKLLGVTLNRA